MRARLRGHTCRPSVSLKGRSTVHESGRRDTSDTVSDNVHLWAVSISFMLGIHVWSVIANSGSAAMRVWISIRTVLATYLLQQENLSPVFKYTCRREREPRVCLWARGTLPLRDTPIRMLCCGLQFGTRDNHICMLHSRSQIRENFCRWSSCLSMSVDTIRMCRRWYDKSVGTCTWSSRFKGS